MHFKTLEIQGFKSFPDKTVLHFDTRMTAVVGSNGNGKSNISDALRWVLGEQGAKTLRGDRMEDVIFHGTTKRGAMGFARVALTIDNADRALAVDADEVVISRKLYRTGESEYRINSDKVRLKDVHELLMGTGLGRDGYSIIGQGRVAEIVGSKGKERREIFDEAAGVSMFLHKKAEAQRDLTRAGENLLRLLDISKELEDRLPVLEKQAEKATKARALLEEEKQTEISVCVAELHKLETQLAESETTVMQCEAECEHIDREIAQLEKDNEAAAEQRNELSARIEHLRRQGDEAKDEIGKRETENAVLENEILHLNARITQLNREIDSAKDGGEAFDREIAALQSEAEGKAVEMDAAKSAEEQLRRELSAIDEQAAQHDGQEKALSGRLRAAQDSREQAKIELSGRENTLRELEERLEHTIEQAQNRERVIAESEEKRLRLRQKADEIEAQSQSVANKLSGYRKLLEGKRQKQSEFEREFGELRRTHQRQSDRHEILQGVERNMEGYQHSVKSVINAAKAGKISGVSGTVADVIRVEKDYSVAIETALGAALQNVIVDNEETAKRCIRYLRDINGGRATFLPMTSVRGSELDVRGLDDEDGFIGIGSELADYDPQFDGIVKSVLGKTAIADDIDTATYLGKKYGYKFRIVTLDGQVVNAGGSFTGGSQRQGAGIISRKQELLSLAEELRISGAKLEEAKAFAARINAEVSKLAIETEGLKEAQSKLREESVHITAEIGGVENIIAQCEEQKTGGDIIINKGRERIAAEKAAIDSLRTVLRESETAVAALSADIEVLGTAGSEIIKRRDQLSAEITRYKFELISLQKDIEALDARVLTARESKRRIAVTAQENVGLIEQANQNIEGLRERIRANERQNLSDSGLFDTQKEEIRRKAQQSAELERQSADIIRQIREKSGDREKFSNAMVLAKERRTADEHRINDITAATLWEKYQLTHSEAILIADTLAAEKDLRAAKVQLTEIRRRIEALGSNINFAAVEELTEVRQRYEDLSKQLSDVETAKNNLIKLIEELTDEIQTTFLQNFNRINEHFSKVFTEIFGGGEARLELSDPDNVLESGSEVFAAPPGKLVKSLIALSGGEQALVAITIYFAILLHRPTPFCMLDEVDAALDEVNIVKYVTYLKQFSERTQLMLITHRRGSIEGCDVLYGVFMQEKGVSRLIRQEIG
jgi:chromosome segregation protein